MKETKKIIIGITTGILLMFLTALLSSCKTTEYIPVESVREEYIDKLHRDSIHVFDSIYIREKGDTVWLTRWRTEYKDRLIRDSIIIRDSIQVPYPVEKKLSRWEKTKMDLGGLAIGGIITIIVASIIGFIIRIRRK